MTTPLRWSPTPAARRLLALVGIAIAVGFGLGRPPIVALAAVPAAFLAVAALRRPAEQLTLTISSPQRCFEGDAIPVSIEVHCSDPVDLFRVRLHPVPQVAAIPRDLQVTRTSTNGALLRIDVTPTRWGRRPVGYVSVELWACGRLFRAVEYAWPASELSVYPRPAVMARFPVSSARFDRSGDHVSRTAGEGVEFHTVRPFTTGDRPRRVNWAVSTRKGSLYVTTTSAERAIDVVLAVDVLADAGPPGASSRDLALRGATGIVATVLRSHDRVGMIAVGGRLQWLRPDLSERQFYRIAEAILDVVDWHSYIDPDIDTIPYSALPAGARVVYFSPLLDERGIEAARRLRARGHPVTIVDVCTSQPASHDEHGRLVNRLWLLKRSATRNQLATLGIVVVAWDGQAALDAVLAPLLTPQVATPR